MVGELNVRMSLTFCPKGQRMTERSPCSCGTNESCRAPRVFVYFFPLMKDNSSFTPLMFRIKFPTYFGTPPSSLLFASRLTLDARRTQRRRKHRRLPRV